MPGGGAVTFEYRDSQSFSCIKCGVFSVAHLLQCRQVHSVFLSVKAEAGMVPVRVLSVNHPAVANLKSNLFHIGRNEMHELFSIYRAGVSQEADEKDGLA